MDNGDKLVARVRDLTGWKLYNKAKIVTDTSDWMRIVRGDILRLEGKEFLIMGNKHETRFGIGEQPKYWVFSAIELETGNQTIIKTEFDEDFTAHIGIFKIHCYRSPIKEAQVLELVKDDSRFMQGYMVLDEKDNHVRIIDFIRGETFFNYIYGIKKGHEQYFHEDLPQILHNLVESIEAIEFLHDHKTCHGDIRNDHIIIDADSGQYRWIDFDLNQHVADFDVWSIGNILNYAIGKGINSFQQVARGNIFSDEVKEGLTPADASAFYEYRIMNLKKLFPYIPDGLNEILMHFTIKPKDYYFKIKDLLVDYREMLERDFPL